MFIEKVKYKKIIIFSLLALGLLILIFYNQKEEETLIENNSSNEISQNNMIENVLEKSDFIISNDLNLSAIQSAVKLLVDNLDFGASLNGCLLKDAVKTMNIIWEGKKWIE